MKIKYNTLYKVNIYIILILNLGFLSFWSVFKYRSMLISSILAIVTFFLYLAQKGKRSLRETEISVYIFLIFLIFFVQLLRWKSLNEPILLQNLVDIINNYDGVFLILLILPIYEIMGTSSKNDFIQNIVKIGYLALLLRVIIWGLYNFSSITPVTYLIRSSDFQRNLFGLSLVRVGGTFLDPVLMAYSVNKYFKSTGKRKLTSLVEIIFILFYSYIVSQYRINLLALVCELLVTSLFCLNKHKKSISKIVFLFVLFLIIILSFNNIVAFFDTFSINNTYTGSSSIIRLNGLPYFVNSWLDTSPLWGMGFVTYEFPVNNVVYWFSDYGFVAELFRFGIIGFLIYVYPFIEGIYISLIYKTHTKDVFVIGLTIYYLFTMFTIDPMENANITVLPFYVAFILNSIHKNRYIDE